MASDEWRVARKRLLRTRVRARLTWFVVVWLGMAPPAHASIMGGVLKVIAGILYVPAATVHGAVHGPLCYAMNEWPDIPTIAVDVPSGMNADTGEICGRCVPAKTTVTLQYAKKGFENPEAQRYLGRLVIADIGIPEVCADDDAWHALKTR